MKFIVTERNYYEAEAKTKDDAIEQVQNNEIVSTRTYITARKKQTGGQTKK